MTQILNLPLLTFSMTIQNNEWWIDSWPYLDANGAPISLAGLTLKMMVRKEASDPVVCLAAYNESGAIARSGPTGRIVIGGPGLNILGLVVPQKSVVAVAPRSYVFEAQATGDGITRTIASGPLTVKQGVVR